MDEQTAVVLAVQLTALCCIAGSLLLYLLCKSKRATAAGQLNGDSEQQEYLNRQKQDHTKQHSHNGLLTGNDMVKNGGKNVINSSDNSAKDCGPSQASSSSSGDVGVDVDSVVVGGTSGSDDIEAIPSPPVRYVLVTCVQNHLGLQLVLRLARLGFRVFAGLQDGDLECDAARIIRAKMKSYDAGSCTAAAAAAAEAGGGAAVILFPLDVTREDSLHEGVDHIRRHLPAGQHGLWAVVHTAGVVVKGRLEVQESCLWDSMFKVNVVGTLRTARALLPLLKVTKGRLITVGLSGECKYGTGVVAYTAARHAVAGASTALGQELAHLGINVVVINTGPITAEHLYHRVRVSRLTYEELTSSEMYLQYNVDTLPDYALETIEEALLCSKPKPSYELRPPRNLSHYITALTDRFSSNRSSVIHNNSQNHHNATTTSITTTSLQQPKTVLATV